MAPKKDYNDYSKFINDCYLNEKSRMLNKTISTWNHKPSASIDVSRPSTNENSAMTLDPIAI